MKNKNIPVTCIECGSEFMASRKDARLCSSTCRSRNYSKKGGLGSMLSPLGPAHFVGPVSESTQLIELYKNLYEKEQTRAEALQRLIDGTNEKEGKGLAGLLNSPVAVELAPILGPSIGRILSNIADKVEKGGKESMDPKVNEIMNWLLTQPDATKDFFIEIATHMNTIADDLALIAFKNNVKSSIKNNGFVQSTFNKAGFGMFH